MSSDVSPNFVEPELYNTEEETNVTLYSSAVNTPFILTEPVISTLFVVLQKEPLSANKLSPDVPEEPLEPDEPMEPLAPLVPLVPEDEDTDVTKASFNVLPTY